MNENEKDPLLFNAPNQAPGTITLFVMVRKYEFHTNTVKWKGETRILQLGSADHLRYAVKNADRETELKKQRRTHAKRK